MGEVIVIASGKGGTGKTTLCANLGAALAKRGKSVVTVDMDMGLRNLDIALGLESSIVYDAADVIEENCTLEDALIKHPLFDSLFFIPAPQTRDASSIGASIIAKQRAEKAAREADMRDIVEDIKVGGTEVNEENDSEALSEEISGDSDNDTAEGDNSVESEETTLKTIWKDFWNRLSERFDYCIVDSPAGIDGSFKYALYGADKAIIITLAETAALRDADRTADVFEDEGVEDIRIVINRIKPDMIEKGIMMNVDTCIDMLGIPILGIIGDDEELISSSLKGELAVNNDNSCAGKAIKNIAARILGEDVAVMEFKSTDKRNLFRKIIDLIFKRKG